jgi:hypothetical protein
MKMPPNACIVGSSKSRLPLAFRWATIVWGLITFIWLPFEDTTIIFLLLLSASWCVLLAGWLTIRFSQATKLINSLFIGALCGLLIFPTALLLALLKAGLHDHGFLDFSTTQLIGIARSTPIWVIIGLLISAAFHYLRSRPQTKSGD